MEQAEYLQVCQKLATEFVGQEADHAEVVWAKVKSYPMWPAQVLSQAAVQKWLSGVKQPKDTVPVMFFSDLTVAWVPRKGLLSWSEGMQKRLFAHKTVHGAVKQVFGLLNWEKRFTPEGWWAKPPPLNAAAAASAAATELPALPTQPAVAIKKPPIKIKPRAAAAASKAAPPAGRRPARSRSGSASALVELVPMDTCREGGDSSQPLSGSGEQQQQEEQQQQGSARDAVPVAPAVASAGAAAGAAHKQEDSREAGLPNASSEQAASSAAEPPEGQSHALAASRAGSEQLAPMEAAEGPLGAAAAEEGGELASSRAGSQEPVPMLVEEAAPAATEQQYGTAMPTAEPAAADDEGGVPEAAGASLEQAAAAPAPAVADGGQPAQAGPISEAAEHTAAAAAPAAVRDGDQQRKLAPGAAGSQPAAPMLAAGEIAQEGRGEAEAGSGVSSMGAEVAVPAEEAAGSLHAGQQEAAGAAEVQGLAGPAADQAVADGGEQSAVQQQHAAESPAAMPKGPKAGAAKGKGSRNLGPKPKEGELGCAKCRYAMGGCVRCRGWQAKRLAAEAAAADGTAPTVSPSASPAQATAAKRQPAAAGVSSPKAKRPSAAAGVSSPKAKRPPAAVGVSSPKAKKAKTGAAAATAAAAAVPTAAAAAPSPLQQLAALPAGQGAGPASPRSSTARRVAGPQLRDTLRSVVNKLKLAVPALRGVDTPNDTPSLMELAQRLFGEAIQVEAQRGRTWTECMAQIFSWARGSAVTPQEVEACFPCVHTNTRFPVFKADLQALANLGLDLEKWEVPLQLEQIRSTNTAAGAGGEGAAALAKQAGRSPKNSVWASALLSMELDTDDAEDEDEPQAQGAKRAKAQGLAPAGGRVAKHKPSRPPTAPVLTAMLQQGGGQLVAGLIPTSAAGSAELRKAMLAAPVRVRAEGAVAAAPTPAAVGSHRSADDPELLARKNRKPQYVHVKQNVWVSKPRPKRLPRDEIPTCSCRAGGHMRVARSARQLGAASAARQASGSVAEAAPASVEVLGSLAPLMPSAPSAVVPSSALPAGAPQPPSGTADNAAAAARRLVEAVFAPYEDPDRVLARQLVASAFAAAVAAVDGPALPPAAAAAAAAPPPSQAPPAVAAGTQLTRARSSSSMGAAGAAVGSGAVMTTRRGAPVGLVAPLPAPAGQPAPRDGCGENCLNRLSFIHCDPRTCPCGDRCSNRPFVSLAPPEMEVFLTPDKGWGVRATQPIPRGTFVVEYAGEVIDDKECQRRAEDAKRRNEPHFYMMEMAPGMIIDARVKGNVARLLNSSCDPNCETQKWHDAGNGEIRVGIFTLRDVAAGEELTYDYHFQHFGLAAAAGAYLCRCGAANCRGTMDTQPERTKDFGRRIEVWWPAEQQWFAGFVTGYSSSTRRHTIKYDDGDVERTMLSAERYRWLDVPNCPVHEPEVDALQQQLQQPGGGKRAQSAAGKRGPSDSSGSGGGKKLRQSASFADPQLPALPASAAPLPDEQLTLFQQGILAAHLQEQQHGQQPVQQESAGAEQAAAAHEAPAAQQQAPAGHEAMDVEQQQATSAHEALGAAQQQVAAERKATKTAPRQPRKGKGPAAQQQRRQQPGKGRPTARSPRAKTAPSARLHSEAALPAPTPLVTVPVSPAVHRGLPLPILAPLASLPHLEQTAFMAHLVHIHAGVQDVAALQLPGQPVPPQLQPLLANPSLQAVMQDAAQGQQQQQQVAVPLAAVPTPAALAAAALPGDALAGGPVSQLVQQAAAGTTQAEASQAAIAPAAAAAAAAAVAAPQPDGEELPAPLEVGGQPLPEPAATEDEEMADAGSMPKPELAAGSGMQGSQLSPPTLSSAGPDGGEEATIACGKLRPLSPPSLPSTAGPACRPEVLVGVGELVPPSLPSAAADVAVEAGMEVDSPLVSTSLEAAVAAPPAESGAAAQGLPEAQVPGSSVEQVPEAQPPAAMQQAVAIEHEEAARLQEPAAPQDAAAGLGGEGLAVPSLPEQQQPEQQQVPGSSGGAGIEGAEEPLRQPEVAQEPQQPESPAQQQEQQEPNAPPLTPAQQRARVLEEVREATRGMDTETAAQHFRQVQAELVAVSQLLAAEDPAPVVDNPGAEAVAGRLHGNGKGNLPVGHRVGSSRGAGGSRYHRAGSGMGGGAAGQGGATRSRRTIRPPSRPYDDFEDDQSLEASEAEEEAYASEDEEEYEMEEEEEDDQPESPPRRYNAEARQRAAAAATMSPATQAAATIAALAGPQPSAVTRPPTRRTGPPPSVPAATLAPGQGGFSGLGGAGAAGRPGRRHPTPPSTGLPARTILVAKKLTNSDVTKGRILLPRAAVEANLSFAIGRAHSLAAADHLGRTWEFTLQSWANGMESRRVYVLEHAGEFVRSHALKPEDVIGISTTLEGAFLIEYNTDEVCNAAETQAAARPGQQGHSPLLPGGAVPLDGGGHNPLISQNAGRCARSEYCNKPAGHPGFCTRTPAGAAAAGAGRSGRRASDASRQPAARAAAAASDSAAVQHQAAPPGGGVVGAGPPPGAKRTHRLLAQAAQLAGQGSGSLGMEAGRPKRARKLTEKAAAMGDSMDEEEEDVESGYETPTPTGPRQQAAAPAAAAGAQPGDGSAVPPIFVMAMSESAPAPGDPLRSPVVTRQPSNPILVRQGSGLPGQPPLGMGGAGAALGMGKLIPSPVQPPVLSPLPALNGPSAVPPPILLPPQPPAPRPQQQPAVDVGQFLAASSPEEEAAAAAAAAEQRRQHLQGLPPLAPQPKLAATVPSAAVAAVKQQPPEGVAGPAGAQAAVPGAPELARAPELQYVGPAGQLPAAAYPGAQQAQQGYGAAGAAPYAAAPSLDVAPLSVPAASGAAAPAPSQQTSQQTSQQDGSVGEATGQMEFVEGCFYQFSDGYWYQWSGGQWWAQAEYPDEAYYQQAGYGAAAGGEQPPDPQQAAAAYYAAHSAGQEYAMAAAAAAQAQQAAAVAQAQQAAAVQAQQARAAAVAQAQQAAAAAQAQQQAAAAAQAQQQAAAAVQAQQQAAAAAQAQQQAAAAAQAQQQAAAAAQAQQQAAAVAVAQAQTPIGTAQAAPVAPQAAPVPTQAVAAPAAAVQAQQPVAASAPTDQAAAVPQQPAVASEQQQQQPLANGAAKEPVAAAAAAPGQGAAAPSTATATAAASAEPAAQLPVQPQAQGGGGQVKTEGKEHVQPFDVLAWLDGEDA